MPQVIELKYLFGVHYQDGSEFFQTPEDVSAVDPKRSAFYDVKLDEVELFQLSDADGHTAIVDLRDGHFEIDGVPLLITPPPPNIPLRLIFYRRHRHTFNVGLDEVGHEIEYHFGWQCTTPEGENIKSMIVLL